jgi:hypothetical protein
MFETFGEIVTICGSKLIYILTPLPRYVLVPGCFKDSQLRKPHREGRHHQTGRPRTDGRAGPGLQAGEHEVPVLQGHQHGDLLAGKDGASKLEVLETMIANWMTDPVH